MGFPLILRRSIDMRREHFFETIEGHILFLFFFLSLSGLPLFDLNLVDDVQGTSIIPLQIRSTQHEDRALLLDPLEKRVSNLTDNFLLHDSF